MLKRPLQVVITALVILVGAAGAAIAAIPPSVTTGSTGTITDTAAVLEGTVNPNGSRTSYFFQWGLTSDYRTDGPSHSTSGTKPAAVETTASGLTPATTYHYRLVALNGAGVSYGADQTFTTSSPPAVTTRPVTGLATSSAVLDGLVNPNGAPTTWSFQYGTTGSYGLETYSRSLPAGTQPVVVSTMLAGLEPGRIFHYRLVARHASSGSVVSYGADQPFMTFPSPRPAPRLTTRTSRHRTPAGGSVLITTGRVSGPTSIPRAFACSGKVTIRSFAGNRRVGYTAAPLQANCTFTGRTSLRYLPHTVTKLRIQVRYLGNHYLAPANPGRTAPITLRRLAQLPAPRWYRASGQLF